MIVTFTRAASKPTHSNGCGPLPALYLNNKGPKPLLWAESYHEKSPLTGIQFWTALPQMSRLFFSTGKTSLSANLYTFLTLHIEWCI